MTQESIGSTPPQQPSIGRIVHYESVDDWDVPFYGHTRAAIITGISKGGRATLLVFHPTGLMQALENIRFSDVPAAGCWNWPPRV